MIQLPKMMSDFSTCITKYSLTRKDTLTIRKRLSYRFLVAFTVIFIFFSGFVGNLNAQEALRGLEGNPVIQKARSTEASVKKLKSTSVDTLILPFIDDFSSTNIFPNPKYWEDDNVFINSTDAYNPLSVGVATFDNFDSTGKIYSNATVNPFYADKLTSRPIDLNFPAEDSVYLSFLYEPGAISKEFPSAKDSLILEFLSKADTTWKKVWSAPGDSLDGFRRAMISIKSEEFLYKGFQFRFKNIATMSTDSLTVGKRSLADPWQLDYVRLDTNRTINDTILKDVAFVKPQGSLLKDYQSMPWEHYKVAFQSELDSVIRLSYRNNDIETRLVTRHVQLSLNGVPQKSILIPGENIAPQTVFNLNYNLENPFTKGLTTGFTYEIKSYIDKINADDQLDNDTVRFNQVFGNYMAYDDGTAESGYGLLSYGSVAQQFYSFISDTIVGINIFFNPTLDVKPTNYFFRLAIWADNNQKPGNYLYVEGDNPNAKTVKFSSDTTFLISPVNPVIVNGRFYIGWVQTNEVFLNVGYDLNHNHREQLFYNVDGTWVNSGFNGTLMIRPVFSTPKDISTPVPEVKGTNSFVIYPNPANDYFSVLGNSDDHSISNLSVFNTMGQLIRSYNQPSSNTFPISDFTNGLYIIKITTKKGETEIHKLLKEK